MSTKHFKISDITRPDFVLPADREQLEELALTLRGAYIKLWSTNERRKNRAAAKDAIKKKQLEAKDEILSLTREQRDKAIAAANQEKQGRKVAEKLAATDRLTGLPNKYSIEGELIKIHKKTVRDIASGQKTGYAVILIDLDDFGKLNKRQGQKAGDKVLEDLAKVLQSKTRGYDYTGRYGGEEFLIILQGVNNLKEAEEYARRLHKEIGELVIDLSNTPTKTGMKRYKTSASIGVNVVNSQELPHIPEKFRNNPWEKVVHDANSALHKAKARGKNAVYSYSHKDEASPRATIRPVGNSGPGGGPGG